MAETSGVVNSTPSSRSNSAPGRAGRKAGKNRLLYAGGAVLGLILFLGHKGSGSGTTTDASNLQAASNALAAQEAAQAQLDPASFSPAGVPVDTGGGSFTSQGPTATTSPAVDLTVNATQPAGAGSGGATASPPPPAGTKPAPAPVSAADHAKGHSSRYTGAGTYIGGYTGNPKAAGVKAVGHSQRYTGPGVYKSVKPSEPAKGKPAPAAKRPNSKGSPQHPATRKKTPSGAKKKSPAVVESMDGFGAGIVVFGRQFPGATGHRLGVPRLDQYGDICRNVTVMYGGRTETHTCHGDGRWWTDRVPGMNPPSRGVAVANDPVPI